MSALDFVFQFSSKGDKDVQAKVEELKKAINDLNKEITLTLENSEKLNKNLKASAKVQQNELTKQLRLERFERAEKRKDEFSKTRAKKLEEREDQRIRAAAARADKAEINLENAIHKQKIDNLNFEERVKDKNHKKELKRERDRDRLSAKARGALKIAGTALGVTFGLGYLRDQFLGELGTQMTGAFTNLPSNYILGLGQASREFGGSPEAIQKSLAGLQSLLTLQHTNEDVGLKLQTNLAMAGLTRGENAMTREEVFSRDARVFLSGIARAYQGLKTDKERRQANEYLMPILGDMSLINMLASGRYDELVNAYSSKAPKENITEGAKNRAEVMQTIEDTARDVVDQFFKALNTFLKEGFVEASHVIADPIVEYVDKSIATAIDNIREKPKDFLRSIFMPAKAYDTAKGIWDYFTTNDEVQAGEAIANTVNNNGNSNVSVNNTYNDNSTTNVSSIDEANKGKEGRANAAGNVFNTQGTQLGFSGQVGGQ